MELSTTEIVKLILLAYGIIMMGWGVYKDIKERKYPNYVLMNVLLSGVLYSLVSGFLLQAVLGFLIVNFIGIFFHKYRLMAAGDMKFLSCLFLFISLRDWVTLLILIAWMLAITLVIGYFFYRKNGMNMSSELSRQMKCYQALFMYRVNLFTDVRTIAQEDVLQKTLPFTAPMYLGFLATLITSGILHLYI